MPAKRFRVGSGHHHGWTKEKSAAVMQKFTESRGRGEPIPLDPAVEAVRDSLEENLIFFMKNVKPMLAKFTASLDTCIPPTYVHAERKQVNLPELGEDGTFHTLRQQFVKEEEAVARAATTTDAEGAAANVAGPPAPDRSRAIQLLIVENADDDDDDEEGGAENDDDDDDDEDDDDDSDSSDDLTAEDAPELVLPDNRLLLKQLRAIKREAYVMMTTFNGIHDWIAFNIPTDPNEGEMAAVMQAVMTQTLALTETLSQCYEMEAKYLSDRLDAETSAEKHPDCYSLRDALLSLEVETWDELKRAWWSLHRVTLIEHSFLAKNMKILTKG